MKGEFAQNILEVDIHKSYQLEAFSITDEASSRRWNEEVWPQLRSLFNTTWPWATEMYYRNLLQQNRSNVILLKNEVGNQLIGASFIDEMGSRRGVPCELGRNVAYNSSVLIRPQFRGRELVKPLLEEQMRQAALLGYEYMAGEYNARTGQQGDQYVRNGFAQSILRNNWHNGRIISAKSVNSGNEEMIIFQLKKPDARDSAQLRRMSFVQLSA